MDTLSPIERSKRMSLVKGSDTEPEMVVRKMLHRLGYRYCLHDRSLPGCPDLVFRHRKRVIFVHGCFWHRHPDPECKLSRMPKSKQDFWSAKFETNVKRDSRNQSELKEMGWSYLIVWECQIRHSEQLKNELVAFLGQPRGQNRARH